MSSFTVAPASRGATGRIPCSAAEWSVSPSGFDSATSADTASDPALTASKRAPRRSCSNCIDQSQVPFGATNAPFVPDPVRGPVVFLTIEQSGGAVQDRVCPRQQLESTIARVP